MAKPTAAVFLEFPDEVDAYLKAHHSGDVRSAPTILISLNPRTYAYLRREGLVAETSISCFDNDSHARALRKSGKVCEWLWKRVRFEDDLGVGFAYSQSLVWYTRIFVHHLLWLIEILHNATVQHDPNSIWVCRQSEADATRHLVDQRERYLGVVAEAFANSRGVKVELFSFPSSYCLKRSRREITRDILRCLAEKVLAPVVARVYRSYLGRLGSRKPVLFTTREYRMADVAGIMAAERPSLSLALMGEWGELRRLRYLFKSGNGSPYHAEACLGLLGPLASRDEESEQSLQVLLEHLAAEIDRATDVFSYRGVSFASLVRRKLESGIGPFILWLHRRARVLRLLLDTVHPSAVLSAGNRDDDLITGELCRKSGIPAMLIDHGSHVAPSNDLERIEWGEHARRLILAPYPYVALQSPLSEGFLEAFPSKGKGVRTGPLVWGGKVDRVRSEALRRRLFERDPSRRVVVHAGTPKGRGVHRFHVYETPDEYVQSVCDLATAVKGLSEVCLVVRFRPLPDIGVKDLQMLVPFSERIILSTEESFLDVLGFADLLVSFSSTTIEEALQNRVPVLLYGGSGRYQHVAGVEVTAEGPCPRAAVYVVRQAQHLRDALRRILEINKESDEREDLFGPYRYSEADRTPPFAFLPLQ
ncbi:MAG: hypothetical protein ACE5JQ_01135 [Candidatus Methylomirabilales bacterium]